MTGYLLIICVDYLYLIHYFDISNSKRCATRPAGDETGIKALFIHIARPHIFPRVEKMRRNTSFPEVAKRLRALSSVRYFYNLQRLLSSVVEHWSCNATESCEMELYC